MCAVNVVRAALDLRMHEIKVATASCSLCWHVTQISACPTPLLKQVHGKMVQQCLESCSGLGTTIPQLVAVHTVFLTSFHKQHRWSYAQPEALLHLFCGKGHRVVWVVQAKAVYGFNVSGVWQTVLASLRFSTACCHDVSGAAHLSVFASSVHS